MKGKFIALLFGGFFTAFNLYSQPINQTDDNGQKQGKWQKKHENGKLRYEGQFKDDKPYGMFKYYYPKGQVQATLNYFDNGSRASSHVFHVNGKNKAIGLYHKEQKDSLWRYFNEDETLISEVFYKDGKQHGIVKDYFPNGKLLQEQEFDNGVKHGFWKQYFVDGKIKQITYYQKGKRQGEYKMNQPDGKPFIEGKYVNDLREGNWFHYGSTGKLERIETYKEGQLVKDQFYDGEKVTYYPNEIPKKSVKFVKGKKNGEFVEYYETGEWVQELKKAEPGSGGKDEYVEVLEGQKVKKKGKFVNDLLEGNVTYFNEDGSVEKVEIYSKGELVGEK